ncbi:MAG: hypothetical protein AAGC73_09800 [Verrucomicrobiota bacterium]
MSAEQVEEQGLEFEWVALWESQYLSEGADALDEGGLFSLEVATNYLGLDWGLWLGVGDSVDYQELALTASKTFDFDWGAMTAGASHLEFWPDRAHDQEFFLGAVFGLPESIELSLDGTYSLEAEGSFVEIGLSRLFSSSLEGLELEPYLLQAIDFGYRTEAYDGWNHFELGCVFHYSINEQLILHGYLAHSIAQEDLDRDGLGDESRAGFGMSVVF